MTFEQLRTFCKVVECRSVSEAAAALFISHPAVSLQLKRLQEEIDAPLFRSTRPHLEVTENGRRVYSHAVAALREVDAIRRVSQHAARVIRLGADQTVGNYVLPAIVQRFRTEHPEVPVEMLTKYRRTLFAKLDAGEADLVVSLAIGVPRRLERRVVGRQRMFVVLSPGHRLADRPALSAADIEGLSFVMPPQRLSGTRTFIDRTLARHHLKTGPVTEIQHPEGIKQAVLSTGDAALLFWPSIAAEVAAGRLVALRIAGLDLALDLCLVRRREPPARTLTTLAQALERELTHVAAQPT